jgi:hypothetical protein
MTSISLRQIVDLKKLWAASHHVVIEVTLGRATIGEGEGLIQVHGRRHVPSREPHRFVAMPAMTRRRPPSSRKGWIGVVKAGWCGSRMT